MSDAPPVFSVITVTFNAADVLGPTHDSLRMQDFPGYEWILVDGASTDGTAALARRLADPARDRILSEADRGVYDAMNKGLRLARGEIVHFLNAGDAYADAGVLSRVAAAFGEGTDAVYGDTLLVLADGRRVLRRALDPAVTLHRRMPVSHQGIFVRRGLHLAHPFDERFRIAADYAAIAAMHRAGARMRYLPGPPLNVNSIEPRAISIRGKVRSAAEDYRVQREILGRPRAAAGWGYLRKRAVILGVRLAERLPAGLIARLPEGIRRRLY